MKILLTGSSGFIGYHLAKKLLENNHFVVGVDNHDDYYDVSLKESRCKKLASDRFKFVKSDINNFDILNEQFDLAINLAAQPGVRVKAEREIFYQTTNIEGFRNFCDYCLKRGINRIIYASSSSVYSKNDASKSSESQSNLRPESKYGTSKLNNEVYATSQAVKNNAAFIGLRFFSVYGPYGRPDMAYYRFTKSLLNNEELTLNNSGLMARDMTYIDDVIDGILGSINYVMRNDSISKNQIFNLGNDKPVKTVDMLKMLELKLNKRAIIKYELTSNEANHTHADISKAKKLLGYNPLTDLDKGLSSFIEWYKSYGR